MKIQITLTLTADGKTLEARDLAALGVSVCDEDDFDDLCFHILDYIEQELLCDGSSFARRELAN